MGRNTGSQTDNGIYPLPAYLSSKTRQHIFAPCIPTRATKVPTGLDWLHEIKHDGYRLIVQREGARAARNVARFSTLCHQI